MALRTFCKEQSFTEKWIIMGFGDFLGGLVGGANPIAGIAGGLISGIGGLFQKNKGSDILKNNPRPQMAIPQEALANQAAARQMANEGLPSEQYQQGIKNIQRNQVAALANAQDRRLGGALVGGIQQRSNDATGNLDVASAEARRQNQMNLQNVNNNVADWRNRVWDYNQRQKYNEMHSYGMGLLGAGNANFMSGLDKVTAGLLGRLPFGGNRQPQMQPSYSSEGVGLADTGGYGYSPGSNTDVVLDPNAYSRGAIIN